MTTSEPRLRIAMQKSGRLSDDTQELLKRPSILCVCVVAIFRAS